jgi:Skp family chaperone for outer membrane proteins
MTTDRIRRWNKGLALVAMACVGAGLAAAIPAATAQAGARTAQPSVIAVVNVNRVLDASKEWEDTKLRLAAAAERRKTEIDKIAAEVATLRQKIEAAPRGSPDRHRMAGELVERGAQQEVREKVAIQLSDLEAGPEVWGLYLRMNDAIKQIATQQGIDLVISDDSPLPNIQEGRQLSASNVTQLTTNRQVLFAGSRIDITDQVVTVLNNQYAAKAGRR